MRSTRIQIWLISLAVVLSVAGWTALAVANDAVGFPLDDGWIHQTYARSLAAGQGWSYFPGQPSAGATAPLWVLLLVPGYWLGGSPFCWVLFLGLLGMWGISVLAWKGWPYLSKHGGVWPLAAGVLLALEWHLLWAALSGMETLLMAVLVLAVLFGLLYLDSRPPRGSDHWRWLGIGALIGAGIWLRPEAVTLFGPALFTVLLDARQGLSRRAGLALAAVTGGLAAFLPYLAFNRWLAGTWWPNTFFAKQAEYAELRQIPVWERLLAQPMPLLVGVGVLLLPGLLFLLYDSLRVRRWAQLSGLLWLFGFIALYAVRLPVTYQHGRYIMPAVPVLALWGLAGVAALTGSAASGRLGWLLKRTWWAALAVLLTVFWWLGAEAYVRDVQVINGEMVVVSAWLIENTAPDDLIAAHDIGAIGYFARREIVDLAGLISPDVIPFIRDEDRLAAYLAQRCPSVLVTFPDWYPELVSGLEMLYQTDTQVTRDFGQTNMAVYAWEDCQE